MRTPSSALSHLAPLSGLALAVAFISGGCDSTSTSSPPGTLVDTVAHLDTETASDGVSVERDTELAAPDGASDDVLSDGALLADTDGLLVDSGATADATSDGGPVSDATETPWGPITGEACGALDEQWASPSPAFLTSTWTFTGDEFDPSDLDSGPARRYSGPNAGGSSKCSEVMSMEWLVYCEGGALYKTETEIVYDTEGSITDYAMSVDTHIIGVSVTRAYLGPYNTDYDLTEADKLLRKKLEGINESSANVSSEDAWTKQLLHIWTLEPSWVPILEEAWGALPASLKSDTVVLVTIEAGSDYIVTDTCDD